MKSSEILDEYPTLCSIFLKTWGTLEDLAVPASDKNVRTSTVPLVQFVCVNQSLALPILLTDCSLRPFL